MHELDFNLLVTRLQPCLTDLIFNTILEVDHTHHLVTKLFHLEESFRDLIIPHLHSVVVGVLCINPLEVSYKNHLMFYTACF